MTNITENLITGARSPIIEVGDLRAVFPNDTGGLVALEEISFNIQSQNFVCVLGQSGSGKSTLLRIIGGLLKPTQGEVLFKKLPILGPSRNIGFVFQESNLMPWRTVLENIMLPLQIIQLSADDARDQARDMVRTINLEGFENWLPRDLSGGMSQRVAIARALVNNPEVLLLDEPFGSLDALTREHMAIELMNIWQVNRKTVIMVTHSISEALMLSDRILVLSSRPGRISLDMTVDLSRPRHQDIRYSDHFISMAKRLREAITNPK